MEYRVLARKYRPSTFADLIGQDVLVRTLSNAMTTGRIAHAFLLTGIRGIGKTTTARIIARALNCEQGPTITPCGQCPNCKMIGEDRHVDVLEMDAASRTGVGDIRELIDTVHYAPTSARYKIYIIDEVHMLSTSAFNALLKTLEEPPPHVKFIFATTESRKIPVTILSRCQRFDLKRIDVEMLAGHLSRIAEKESYQLTPEAAKLLSQAAEGSVRDGLSLLDQTIAHHTDAGVPIPETLVRGVLGLADKTKTIGLLSELFAGKPAEALALFRALYEGGADPLMVLQDLLELTHFITRIKLVPTVANDLSYAEHERASAAQLAGQLAMPNLTRLWQLLLKGISEVKVAPSPAAAAEMVLVRAAYMAELPSPADVIKAMQDGTADAPPTAAAPAASQPQPAAPRASAPATPAPALVKPAASMAVVENFEDAVALLEREREVLSAGQLRHHASLVSFAPGHIDIHMKTDVSREFTARIAQVLGKATGQEWKVTLAAKPGAPTLNEQAQMKAAAEKQAVGEDALVKNVLEQFPGAELLAVSNG